LQDCVEEMQQTMKKTLQELADVKEKFNSKATEKNVSISNFLKKLP